MFIQELLIMDHTRDMEPSQNPSVAEQGCYNSVEHCALQFEKTNGNRTSLNILRVHCTDPTPYFSEVTVASVVLLKIPQINLKSSITEVPSLPGSSTFCNNVKQSSKYSQTFWGISST